MKEAQEAASEFVKARNDMAKMLDFVDETLHQMAFTIQPSIIIAWLLAALMRWNDRDSASFKDKVDEVLTCIASVCNQLLIGKAFAHFNSLGTIMVLPCGQPHPHGVTQTIDTHMNLGAEPASAAAQRLFSLPARF